MAGRISVRGELSLDGTGWQRGLRTAEQQTEHFGKETLGELKGQIAAAFSIGAVLAFTKGIIESAAHIKDMSEQTGLTTDNVQRLAAAAKMVGLEFEDIATALAKMGTIRKAAGMGDEKALETLKAYGIEWEDIQDAQKSNLDLLDQMAQKTGHLNALQREQLREIFGKGGAKMGAVMGAINGGVPASLVSEEDINNIDRFAKINAKLWQDIKNGASTRFGEVITALFTGKDKIEKADAAARALHDIFGLDNSTIESLRTVPHRGAGGMGALKAADLYGESDATRYSPPLYGFRYDIEKNNAKIEANYKEPVTPGLKMQSDSLVRVGNFLGDAPKMAQIAETHLKVSQDILTEHKTTNRLLKSNSNGDGFPNQ